MKAVVDTAAVRDALQHVHSVDATQLGKAIRATVHRTCHYVAAASYPLAAQVESIRTAADEVLKRWGLEAYGYHFHIDLTSRTKELDLGSFLDTHDLTLKLELHLDPYACNMQVNSDMVMCPPAQYLH